MKTNAILATSIAALVAHTALAQLTWDSAGSSDDWSTVSPDTNWLPGNVLWTQNQSAIFSGAPEAINVQTQDISFNTITFDVSGFSITSLGMGNFTLANASTIRVTNLADSASIAEKITGTSMLTKVGAGTLTLNGTAANTYSGGTIINAGTLAITHAGSLGTGPVTNNATLNLMGGAVTYTGLSHSMSGSGIVNVTLGTGTGTTVLDGLYASFTGTWNVGIGAAAGAGKAQMNAPNNALATINVLTHGSVFAIARFTHNASIVLNGGDTGESLGQLRLDVGAAWAGPVDLAGAITGAGDAFVGSNAGIGTISGVISGAQTLSKTGAGTIVLSGVNNSYNGGTSVLAGALSVSLFNNTGSIGNVGTGSTISLGTGTTAATLIYTGAGETTNRVLDLPGTTGGATLTQSGASGNLKLTGGVTATGAGIKTLTLQGSTGATGEISGVIEDNFTGANTTAISKAGTGRWTLSGVNTYTGATTITGGTLAVGNVGALGPITNVINVNGGTLDLATDTSVNAYVISTGTGSPGMILSNRATPGAGINHTLGAFQAAGNTYTFASGGNVTGGTASITLPSLNLRSGTAGSTALLSPETAVVSITGPANIGLNALVKTLGLGGSSTGNSISGVISNNLATLSLAKSGTSTWTLSGANTFTGATQVNGGTLTLDYGTQDSTKLADGAALTFGGGTLNLSGGMHTELVASSTLTANTAASSVSRSSGVALLRLNAVTPNGGTGLVFMESGIADTDALNTNGILGFWARTNIGGVATWAKNATDTADGSIVPYAGYTNVSQFFNGTPAGTILNGATTNVRIVHGGTSGNITLGGGALTQVYSVQMDASLGAATIAPVNNTDVLNIGNDAGGAIWQSAAVGALTVGMAAGNGVLTSGAAANAATATLRLINDSTTTPLTINSIIANNGTDPVAVTKSGEGTVVLAGNNTLTGAITIAAGAGPLILSGDNSLRPAGTSNLTTITDGGILQLEANMGNTSFETSTALSQEQTANQPLFLASGGLLRLRGDTRVTFAGGNNMGGLGTATINIDVNQRTGAGTNKTLTIAPLGFNVNNTTINVTGGNGYTLGVGPITTTTSGTTLFLNPTSANLSVAGYTAGATLSGTVVLTGSALGNVVTGAIATPPTSGTVTVIKTGSSSWDLQGVNTYTGTTTVREGTLTLSGLRMATSGAITVGDTAGLSPTLNISNGNWSLGATTFTVAANLGAGTVNQNGGSISFTGGTQLIVGNSGSTGTYNLSAGTLTAAAVANRGVILGVNTDSTGIFNLSGSGSLDLGTGIATLQIGRSDAAAINTTGIFNQTGGTASIGTLTIGGGAGSATNTNTTGILNVTGGFFTVTTFSSLSLGESSSSTITFGPNSTATVPVWPTARGGGSVPGSATLIFDGGTLIPAAASAAYMGELTHAFIKNLGAKINVPAGRDITISQVFEDFSGHNGGFTKLGTGTLTLTGTNTFTGAATVTAGTIVAASDLPLGGTTGAGVTLNPVIAATVRFTSAAPAIASLANTGAGTSSVLLGDAVSGTPTNLTVGGNGTSTAYSGAIGDLSGVNPLAVGSVTKVGAGIFTLSGVQTYATLNANEGAVVLDSALGTGASIVNVAIPAATVAVARFGVSQTLAELNIGDGGTAILGGPPPAPPEFGGEFAGLASTGAQAVPEPGSAALLLGGMLTLLGLRRRA